MKLLTETEEQRFKTIVESATCFRDISRAFPNLHPNQINWMISRRGLRKPYARAMTKKTTAERTRDRTRQVHEIEQHHRDMIGKSGDEAVQEHIAAQQRLANGDPVEFAFACKL